LARLGVHGLARHLLAEEVSLPPPRVTRHEMRIHAAKVRVHPAHARRLWESTVQLVLAIHFPGHDARSKAGGHHQGRRTIIDAPDVLLGPYLALNGHNTRAPQPQDFKRRGLLPQRAVQRHLAARPPSQAGGQGDSDVAGAALASGEPRNLAAGRLDSGPAAESEFDVSLLNPARQRIDDQPGGRRVTYGG